MADEGTTIRSWQCPPAAAAESIRLGWLNEACEEGLAWLRSQRGYDDFRKALDVLSGRDITRPPAEYRSKLNTNPLKRDVREVVGTLARLRPFWGYHSDNKSYAEQAEMMNKVTRALYLEQFFDLRIKDALKFAAATNRGFIRPVYRRNMYGTGQGNIQLFAYGSPSILPVQMPQDGDYQNAYGVTILDEMPIAMAHGMFPLFQHRILPVSSRYWYSSDAVREAARGNWLKRAFNATVQRKHKTEMSDLLAPIRYTYVIDLTINKTDKPIPMGEPGASWSYVVPALGQRIPVGRDPKTGAESFRVADENDARLYPRRRLIISTEGCIMYDGPAFDWHGMLPLASFCFDAWPWEPIGFSLVHEGFEINEAIKEITRGNMDKVRAGLRPSLAYDSNAIAKKEADRFDPFMPDARMAFDGSSVEGAPFHPGMDPEMLKISAESMEFLGYLNEAMHSQLAIQDVMTLAKMRAVGSMDELEKIVESSGPIVEDMSRSMEPPMRDIGVMVKYNVLQHMTTTRVMQYIGEDNIHPVVFDYNPDSLVPSHMTGEDPDRGESSYSKIERARMFADNLRFFILPNSLHEITQMAMKLGLVQLKKAGVIIDSQTIAESWQIPNWGSLDGNTVIDRWKNEQEMQLEFAARMKELASGEGLVPPGAANPAGGKQNPEGRPPTGQAAPRLISKEGGARSTIAESK